MNKVKKKQSKVSFWSLYGVLVAKGQIYTLSLQLIDLQTNDGRGYL
jgi:hypothetical protein